MLAVIGETARHAGHADIIRELLDGRTGRWITARQFISLVLGAVASPADSPSSTPPT
jgi:Protein of unknown function (DUF664)